MAFDSWPDFAEALEAACIGYHTACRKGVKGEFPAWADEDPFIKQYYRERLLPALEAFEKKKAELQGNATLNETATYLDAILKRSELPE